MESRRKAGLFQGVSPLVLAVAGMTIGGAAAAQGAAQADDAQDGPVKLGPVRVGGEVEGYRREESASPKFTAPLVDTPKTVTVITRELMEERSAHTLTEVLRTTPGVTLGSGEGGTPLGDRPFIRGYEASTDIFVDGVRNLGRANYETFNLEQIEIVKGPGSSRTGRGSTGGSLNMITKTPHQGNSFTGSVQLGTDETKRVTVDGNYQLDDNVAFRLNAMYHDAEVAGRDSVENERWGVAPSLTLGLGQPTRATLSYYALRTDDIPDLGIPFADSGNGQVVSPPKVDRSNFYGYLDRDYREVETDIATAVIEHDVTDAITLRNTTRYTRVFQEYLVTRPSFDANGLENGVVTTGVRGNKRHTEAFLNQTDLYGKAYHGDVEHSFAIGAEISRERLKSASSVATGATGGTQDLYNPDPRLPGPGTPYSWADYGEPNITKTKALYALDTIRFNEQILAEVGLRYDNYKVETADGTREDDIWNYNLGIIYKPAENGSIYISWGTSANPSGETAGQSGGSDGAAGGGFRDLAPEKSRSLELGTKWDLFDEQLSLTAAVFETKKTDARSQDPVTGEVVLSGSNRVRGFELAAAGSITPEWQLWAGYTWLDPEVTRFINNNVDYSGKVMKFVAKHNFTLWTTYELPFDFTLGGGVTYTGKRFMNDANTLWFKPTWRFDAMAAYKVNENVDLRLNVLNLTDETIYDASHVGVFAVVAPGRSALLSANVKF